MEIHVRRSGGLAGPLVGQPAASVACDPNASPWCELLAEARLDDGDDSTSAPDGFTYVVTVVDAKGSADYTFHDPLSEPRARLIDAVFAQEEET